MYVMLVEFDECVVFVVLFGFVDYVVLMMVLDGYCMFVEM